MIKTISAKKILFQAIVMLTTNQAQSLLNFSSQNSTLNLSNPSSALVISTPITNFKGTLGVQSPSSTSVQGSTASCTIAFSEGILNSGQNNLVLTGTYDPTGIDVLELGDGDRILASNGQLWPAIVANGILANPSILEGPGDLASAISIANGSSALQISIKENLLQNITLNSGTAILGNDLSFGPGYFFSGTGSVDCAEHKLEITGANNPVLSANVTFSNATNVVVDGYVSISGNWTFSGNGQTSTLNARGSILDLSSGGQITVDQNHTLLITNAYIKGLSSTEGKFSINSTGGIVKFCNTTLEISGQYSHNSGQIYFWGDGGTIVSAASAVSSNSFDVSASAVITVDKTTLFYQTLGWEGINPMTWTNQASQENLINGGLILPAPGSSASGGPVTMDQTASTPTLWSDQILAQTRELNLTNSLGTAQSMTLFGNGNRIVFPSQGQYLSVANSLTVTFQDAILENYRPDGINLGLSAAVAFGNNATVRLWTALSIPSLNQALTVNGSGEIDGNGQTITVSVANGISISGSNTLRIKNATLICQNSSAIRCLSDNAKIILENTRLVIDPSLTIATGSVDIQGNSSLEGGHSATPDTQATLTWSSGGQIAVKSHSTLKVDGHLDFVYQADPTTNGDTYTQSKRHLSLTDPSSRLELSACTLTTTATGLALDHGKLKISDLVTFSISTATGAQMELGSALELFLNPAATLKIDGPVEYNPTSYP